MAQQLRALAALPKDPGLHSNTHMVVPNNLSTLASWGLMLSSGVHEHCTSMVHLHTYRRSSHSHKIKYL